MNLFKYQLISLIFLLACQGTTTENMTKIPEGKNRLALSKSPYLLQHADNPVDWYPWGEEAFQKAKDEDKPVLVSIGYSSCHWCHVMAHESFEDTAVAKLMNENFVNIKLDREERPDVDQIYMDAVQAMGLNGGWPLNVFVTPDQKPFYGGTYFPKEKWTELVVAISEAFENNREKLNESADNFAKHIATSEIEKYGIAGNSTPLSLEDFEASYNEFSKKFDPQWGGIKKAPKFPMPSVWRLLLAHHQVTGNEQAKDHFLFTLEKIAEGGIYDQIGGGFARYSVDDEWHVPHFEKMLYDNGQLLSLYASGLREAKTEEQKRHFERVILETITWLKREMQHDNGGFYAALDADSEGEEGKFYTWTSEEIQALAGENFDLIAAYYYILERGNWEGVNVPRRLLSDQEISQRFNLTASDLEEIIAKFKKDALEKRATRIRPGLDSKIIAGWNGLLLTGLCDVYQVLGSPEVAQTTKELAAFMKNEMFVNGKLLRTDSQDIEGFLEDYAAVIQAFITYYQTFFDEEYLHLAQELNNRVMETFYDENEHLFFFTGDQAESLIARKKEIFDNVIPSSNALMAENLFLLGTIFDDDSLLTIHDKMFEKVRDFIKKDPEFMSLWARISISKLVKPLEIVIVGEDYEKVARQMRSTGYASRIFMASASESELPLMTYKTTQEGKTTIYVCSEKVCRRPVTSVEEAFEEIAILTQN